MRFGGFPSFVSGVVLALVSLASAQPTHVLLRDFYTGPIGGIGTTRDATQDRLYYDLGDGSVVFFARTIEEGREFWKTDGTPGGTMIVADLVPGSGDSAITYPRLLGGTLLFQAGPSGDRELWRSDGTPGGTFEMFDFLETASGNPRDMVIYQGAAYCVASAPGTMNPMTNTAQLWKTDGTGGGTTLVIDFETASGPSDMTAASDFIYFGYFDAPDFGDELLRTDGTFAGTVRVADIAPGGDSSTPRRFAAAQTLTYFNATTGPGMPTEVYRTDGTDVGTFSVSDLASVGLSNPVPAGVTLDNRYFFVPRGNANNVPELWVSSGQTGDAHEILDVRPGKVGGTVPDDLFPFGGNLYFSADDGTHGRELWVTDGTAGGTRMLADIGPAANSAFPHDFFGIGDVLYFFVTGGPGPGNSNQIWRTDGTEEGTFRAFDTTGIAPAGAPYVLGTKLIFAAGVTGVGTELYVIDLNALFPGEPYAPAPPDGDELFSRDVMLGWNAPDFAETYDLYLWKEGDAEPGTPTIADLSDTLVPQTGLSYGRYNWYVVAKNDNGSTRGPTWTFALTRPRTAIQDFMLGFRDLTPEQEALLDLNGDSLINIADLVFLINFE